MVTSDMDIHPGMGARGFELPYGSGSFQLPSHHDAGDQASPSPPERNHPLADAAAPWAAASI